MADVTETLLTKRTDMQNFEVKRAGLVVGHLP